MADQGGDVWGTLDDAVKEKGSGAAADGQIDNDGTTMADLDSALDSTADEETTEEVSDEAPPTLPPMETPVREASEGLATLGEDEELEDDSVPNHDQFKMSGLLEKKGHVIANWKTRFFTFDPNTRGLKYFDKESDTTAK
jgi:hypothetical protein